jgi:S-(hydroxymethyl)glutathione dehydrogenase / alcohol dehydrogenase
MCSLGTFAEYSVVNQASLVKIPRHLPLEPAALVACGVTTGRGSAVYAAQVRPGDTVVVIGTGGVGMNAVQGAAAAGARQVARGAAPSSPQSPTCTPPTSRSAWPTSP